MEIIIDKEMTVLQLIKLFSEIYPFLKIEVYDKGEEISFDFVHTLHSISRMRNPESFTIIAGMSISEVEKMFWDKLGLQVAIFRKVGNSWLTADLTNNLTLERQNELMKRILQVAV